MEGAIINPKTKIALIRGLSRSKAATLSEDHKYIAALECIGVIRGMQVGRGSQKRPIISDFMHGVSLFQMHLLK